MNLRSESRNKVLGPEKKAERKAVLCKDVVTKGIRGHRASALTLVMAKWHASVLVLMLQNIQEPTGQ